MIRRVKTIGALSALAVLALAGAGLWLTRRPARPAPLPARPAAAVPAPAARAPDRAAAEARADAAVLGRADGAFVTAERRLLLDAYGAVFADPGMAGLRGTALRSIGNAAQDDPGAADAAGLDARVLSVLADPAAGEPALLTAVRMASARRLAAGLPAVSNLAARGGTPLLRRAARRTLEELAAPTPP